jgi:hypothetical protein
MVSADNGRQAGPYPRLWAEEAFRAVRRAEHAWQLARAAQRSAANSLDNSAASHERTANVYEKAAERGDLRRDERRERAARHRGFALEDRRIAERLRQMAAVGFVVFVGDPGGVPDGPQN